VREFRVARPLTRGPGQAGERVDRLGVSAVHASDHLPTEARRPTRGKRTPTPTGILALQRTIGNRGVGRLLQRQPGTGEEFKPCPSAQWYTEWHFYGVIPGGPYADQGITIAYDKIAPIPDPLKGADAQEQRKVFTTPALLEQLYHDATVPLASSPNRRRALWFVCIIEDVAQEIGFVQARDLHKVGCLTIYNCGVDWNKPFANFSDKTASGLRVRGIALKAFVDKSAELGAYLSQINSALLLLGGISAARAGLARGPTPAGVPRVKPPAPTTTVEPTKSAAPPEPVSKPPAPVPTPKTPPASATPRSAVEIGKALEQAGLTQKQIRGLTGGRVTPARAKAIDRLLNHFTPADLKALGDYLAEKKLLLSEDAVGELVDGIRPGEMAAWVKQARIADVHGEATRLRQDAKEKSVGEAQDPNARARVTNKPSPGREPRPFRRGNFAHRFAEYLMDAGRLPRPSRAEVVVPLRDGTGDIIRPDRIISTADAGRLFEIRPTGRAAEIGRAQLRAREAALQKEFPKKNGWRGEVVEYTREDVAAWLRREADAAKAQGKPPPDVAEIMRLFGF
jgi:hypothetical protein